jgi:hypothetical protein
MFFAVLAALEVFRSRNIRLILAHGTNGKHSAKGSLHYSGAAIDIHWDPTWGDETVARLIEQELTSALGNGAFYDVLWKGGNHFHIEFQPKDPANYYHFP